MNCNKFLRRSRRESVRQWVVEGRVARVRSDAVHAVQQLLVLDVHLVDATGRNVGGDGHFVDAGLQANEGDGRNERKDRLPPLVMYKALTQAHLSLSGVGNCRMLGIGRSSASEPSLNRKLLLETGHQAALNVLVVMSSDCLIHEFSLKNRKCYHYANDY